MCFMSIGPVEITAKSDGDDIEFEAEVQVNKCGAGGGLSYDIKVWTENPAFPGEEIILLEDSCTYDAWPIPNEGLWWILKRSNRKGVGENPEGWQVWVEITVTCGQCNEYSFGVNDTITS